MGLIEDFDRHLGKGKTLYTKARGVKFRASVSPTGFLVVESEKSGRREFSGRTVIAAAAAIESGAIPDDLQVKVARSWVGAVQDSMQGRRNRPKVGTRVGKPTRSLRAAGKTALPGRPKPSAAGRKSRSRVPRDRTEGLHTVDTAPTAVEVAREIGREIARALGSGSTQETHRVEDALLPEMQSQLSALTAELDRLKAERSDAVAKLEAAENLVAGWRGAGSQVTELAVGALIPRPSDKHTLPSELANLLVQSASIWKSAPSGSVGTARSALELTLRVVAARVAGAETYETATFGELHQYLMSRRGSTTNLSESDLHLAFDLYRRSSKSGHAEQGWKATPLEALLIWSGVSAIADHAFASRLGTRIGR